MRTIFCSSITAVGVFVAGSAWAAAGDGVINSAQGLMASQGIAPPAPLASLSLGNNFMPSVYMGAGSRTSGGPIGHHQADTNVADVSPVAPAEDRENSNMLLSGLAVIVALVARRISG